MAILRLLILVVFCELSLCKAITVEKPNIIFIMADDMGYGDAGCFGGKLIRTPNIDQLASEGMRFTQCYAGSTVCAPSRSVLMTGLHTGHTRVRGNFGKWGVKGLGGGKGRVPLRENDITVAEILKLGGYSTGITGKWGLGEPSTMGTPNKKGFDEWFGYLNQRRAHSFFPTFIWLNEGRFDLPGNANGKQQQYTHDLFTGFALSFIRKNKSKPFFLYLPYTVPHSRFEIPDLGPYANRSWPEKAKVYAAMITRMDDHIGQIISLLKELVIDKKTIVFFCSDNGAANRYDGLFDSSGLLRGRKRDMYEGGLRTPMIVRWPGKVPANQTSEAVWSFTDFLPTAADLANVQKPKMLDGISVLPTLLGKAQETNNRFLYWEFFEGGFQQAARWKNWKVIRRKKNERLELYDLNEDIGETRDISKREPKIIAKFEKYLKTARTESEDWPIN
ncbi:MAG: arylsulfatase [Verrucomicrobiota bacterium]|nr:arylsulfatase [Verrucomicrobiota bacterium]